MWRNLKFELKVWWLRWARERLSNRVSREYRKEKKKDPSFSKGEFYANYQYDFQELDIKIEELVSAYWLDVADRWNISVSSQINRDHWDRNNHNNWVLTREGVSSIRKPYYENKMNSQSTLMPWLTFWVALVAAAGTLWELFHDKGCQ